MTELILIGVLSWAPSDCSNNTGEANGFVNVEAYHKWITDNTNNTASFVAAYSGGEGRHLSVTLFILMPSLILAVTK